MAAVTASLVFALSGGVAIADEAAATAQPAAEAAAQEQATTETQATGAEGATASAATGGSTVGQAQDSGEASNQAGEKDEADGAKADEAAAKDGRQAEEAKSGETTDAQKAGEAEPGETTDAQKADGAKTDRTADAKDAAGSGEVGATVDDVALEAQVATMWKRGDTFVNNGGFAESDDTQVDESTVNWIPVEVDVPSDVKYVDEDGYRIYYGVAHTIVNGKSQPIKWAKIGPDGELLLPSDQSKSAPMSFVNTENYTLANFSSNFWARLLHYDAVKDVLVPYNGGFYYPGGEYGAEGIFYYKSVQDREAGLLTHANQGAVPNSGTSAVGQVATDSFAASLSNYESGTATATPATGSAYVSPTASAAAETTPATSDATSLAGVAAAAVSALGALGLGKAIRRK